MCRPRPSPRCSAWAAWARHLIVSGRPGHSSCGYRRTACSLAAPPRSDEEDGLEDLASAPHREAPGSVGDDPATTDHDESIHDEPARPNGQLIDTVGDRPRASVTTVPSRVGTRARDGPAMA